MKNNSIKHPPLLPSSDYYAKTEFDFPITASLQIHEGPTVLKRKNGITFIYFQEGEGEIVVNSIPLQVQPGLLLCLGSYHYFNIRKVQEKISLIECRLSYDAFLYMAANPYYKFSEIFLSSKPLLSTLTGRMKRRTEDLLEQFVQASKRHQKKGGKIEFLLAMRLLGILQKTCKKLP